MQGRMTNVTLLRQFSEKSGFSRLYGAILQNFGRRKFTTIMVLRLQHW
jgi:hypothetical protein